MELRLIPIPQLKFADYNPRKISKENFERLRTSIKEFGFSVPCTVNMHPGREYVLIGGHMRVRAAELEGMKEVPCYIVDLDLKKEKLLNVALNNRGMQGTWDEGMLSELLVGLNREGANIKLTGFNDEEVTKLVDEQVPLHGSGGVGDPPPGLDQKPTANFKCPQCGWEEGKDKSDEPGS